jgi:hypothetical protein
MKRRFYRRAAFFLGPVPPVVLLFLLGTFLAALFLAALFFADFLEGAISIPQRIPLHQRSASTQCQLPHDPVVTTPQPGHRTV